MTGEPKASQGLGVEAEGRTKGERNPAAVAETSPSEHAGEGGARDHSVAEGEECWKIGGWGWKE